MTNEETIKNLKKLRSFHNGSYASAVDKAIEALKEERPQGEWIEHSDGYISFCTCNKCNGFGYKDDNFCNNCGADMRKGGAENWQS